jgi:hypothetical protein
MDGEILDVVTEWGTRPVADGVSGLYELADGEFSGAVTDGTAWAFVLNGRFVGVFDGTIEDFEDASLTAYTAPDMALPLLYAMQARGGEVRGQYYSNDTPLSEIDGTLSSGNFVGYVELSENVLSGDYYVVYYGGRALPVAYVGNSRRLLSGDEAFERAADEVGIYSVVDADIEVVDLPERPAGMEAASGSEPADSDDDVVSTADADPGADTGDAVADDADASTAAGVDTDDADDGDASATTTEDEFRSLGELSGVDDPPAPDAEASTTDADAESSETPSESDGGAVDPAQTEAASSTADTAATPDASVDDVVIDDATADGASTDTDATATPEELDRLRRELDAVRSTKAEVAAERDRIASERDDLSAEVDRLRDRVASLESEIERLEREADGAGDAGAAPAQELSPDEALSKTNLFVRYEDKATATLERAAEGRVSPAELRDNLRLNYHTEFETDGVTIDGQPFEPFLRGTPEHRFAEWLLTAVTHEIRRTDTRAELSKLYEAIESVDRIDLDGEVDVTVEDTEGGVETSAVAFDVVFRDKMGDPLFAASFDDSRDPTRAGTIRSLLDGAESVSRAVESFAAAFVVTTSFFDADAMEVAVDATRGGLFSRSSRKSYVKLSRKSGFHLCLVEARDEDFFLSVPEL